MGRDKAVLPWSGAEGVDRTLLDHSIQRLRHVCQSVKVCLRQAAASGPAEGPRPGDAVVSASVVEDAAPGMGPLGGIVAALEQSTMDWNMFLAVDLPLVPVRFLELLLERRAHGPGGALCIVPTLEGRPQPLCSLVHRSLAPGLRSALDAGNCKVMAAFRATIEQSATQRHSSAGLDLWEIQDLDEASELGPKEWFLNVNSMADWRQAQRLAAGRSAFQT